MVYCATLTGASKLFSDIACHYSSDSYPRHAATSLPTGDHKLSFTKSNLALAQNSQLSVSYLLLQIFVASDVWGYAGTVLQTSSWIGDLPCCGRSSCKSAVLRPSNGTNCWCAAGSRVGRVPCMAKRGVREHNSGKHFKLLYDKGSTVSDSSLVCLL